MISMKSGQKHGCRVWIPDNGLGFVYLRLAASPLVELPAKDPRFLVPNPLGYDQPKNGSVPAQGHPAKVDHSTCRLQCSLAASVWAT